MLVQAHARTGGKHLEKIGPMFQVLSEILEACFHLFKSQPPFHNYRSFVLSVQSFSTNGNVRNNSLTSQHDGLEISSSEQEGILYSHASIWAVEVPQSDHRGIFYELFTFSTSICRLFSGAE